MPPTLNTSSDQHQVPDQAKLLARWAEGHPVDLASLNGYGHVADLVVARDRWGDRVISLMMLQLDPDLDGATLAFVEAAVADLDPAAMGREDQPAAYLHTCNPTPLVGETCTDANIVNWANVPQCLRARTCVWRMTEDRKPPFQSLSPGQGAQVDHPEQWVPLDRSLETYRKYRGTGQAFSGIGVLLTDDGNNIVGIDLDHCLDEAGGIVPEAKQHFDQLMPTYCEVSRAP